MLYLIRAIYLFLLGSEVLPENEEDILDYILIELPIFFLPRNLFFDRFIFSFLVASSKKGIRNQSENVLGNVWDLVFGDLDLFCDCYHAHQ